jgi:putative DNA methylase
MAIVAEGKRGRVYLPADEEHERIAANAKPTWAPEGDMPKNPRWFSPPDYGMPTFADLFTPRQLVALTTFSDLVLEARAKALEHARTAAMAPDPTPLADGGNGAQAYAELISVYLAFVIDKTAEHSNTCVVWYAKENRPKGLFARQAIPMVWDFVEQNPLGDIGGAALRSSEIVADAIPAQLKAAAASASVDDAVRPHSKINHSVVSTDPPYYNNVGYADLSDFFMSG